MRKPISQDRRFDDRHPGTGLVALIEGVEFEVLDISIGGMKVPLPTTRRIWKGQVQEFELRSTHWPDMKIAFGKGEVRALTSTWAALQFVRPNYDLMKCVSRHVAGLVWGDKPYGY
ncbi:MAG: PilZ domain-containing protein [Rhodospirillaceae bacterium]|nr:PilZ domain-containing protein [Rhodospirillales bacterium]